MGAAATVRETPAAPPQRGMPHSRPWPPHLQTQTQTKTQIQTQTQTQTQTDRHTHTCMHIDCMYVYGAAPPQRGVPLFRPSAAPVYMCIYM